MNVQREPLLSFRLNMDPPKLTAQQKGTRAVGNKVHHYTKSEVRELQETFLRRLEWYRPAAPLTGTLGLTVVWTYRWRETDLTKTGKKKAQISGCEWVPCPTRPDCSNIIKLFEDTLTVSGYFLDDGQVANLTVWKGWGDDPGITVNIERLLLGQTTMQK